MNIYYYMYGIINNMCISVDTYIYVYTHIYKQRYYSRK